MKIGSGATVKLFTCTWRTVLRRRLTSSICGFHLDFSLVTAQLSGPRGFLPEAAACYPQTSGSSVSTAAQITQAWWLPFKLFGPKAMSGPRASRDNQLCRNRIVPGGDEEGCVDLQVPAGDRFAAAALFPHAGAIENQRRNCSDWGKLGSGEDGVQGLVGVAAAQAPGAEQGSQDALSVAPLG